MTARTTALSPRPYIAVLTNGWLLSPERARALRDAGCEQISISIDHVGERHDERRRLPGLFARLERQMPELRAIGFDRININSININHAAYWAVGHDSLNPIANQPQDISAFMAALELSYDRDWTRFRVSAFYASGDDNPNNHHATGFDAILDNPNFAGGEFSYWQRQTIPLFGVNLTNRESLLPDLRSSKTQAQSNFVNPGLLLLNTCVDFELTPKLRWINNINFLWFDSVEVLRTFTFAEHIDNFIGVDLSSGIEYRPLLSNNIIVTAGLSCLVTGTGFRDLYGDSNGSPSALVAGFVDLILRY